MALEELVNLIATNGIGVVCVCYLMYFQHTTMNKMLDTLDNINLRLVAIETKVDGFKCKTSKEEGL